MAKTLEQDRRRKAAKKAAANEIGKLPKVADPGRRERCRHCGRTYHTTEAA